MKRSTKVTVAALVALTAIGGIAYAAKGYSEHRKMHRAFAPEKILERVDVDKDGAASRQEMSALVSSYFNRADSNGDGSITKAEIVIAIDESDAPDRLKRRSGRVADRILRQADINQDGNLELAEIENRVGKFHSLADWNDDGKVEMAEAKRMRGGFGRHGRKEKRD